MTGSFPPPPPARPLRPVRDLVALLCRQAGLVGLCALAGVAAALVAYRRQPPVYVSTARVWVADRAPAGQALLARRRASAQAVDARLGIRDDQLPHGLFARRAAAAPAAAPDPHTVDLFLDALSVEPVRGHGGEDGAGVLELRLACTDPALAPRALQAFLDSELEQDRQRTAPVPAAQLAQARDELRRAQDRIVGLLARDGGLDAGLAPAAGAAPARRLRLDLDPGAGAGPRPELIALDARAWGLRLRLDDARAPHAGEERPSPASTTGGATPLESGLDRLERGRRLAQERYAQLRRQADEAAAGVASQPGGAERRVIVDAPDRPRAADGHRDPALVAFGPLAGLVLGLLFAGLRELGGDRFRSARDAEGVLGAPVLGAIPTLSARAREALLLPPAGGPGRPA